MRKLNAINKLVINLLRALNNNNETYKVQFDLI